MMDLDMEIEEIRQHVKTLEQITANHQKQIDGLVGIIDTQQNMIKMLKDLIDNIFKEIRDYGNSQAKNVK
jgi:phosphotransferase system IIB component